MNKILKNKKFMSLMLALMMIVSVFAPGLAQAAVDDSNLAMLTFDSQHFTIVDKIGTNIQIEAKGLTSTYQPTTIDPNKVTWETSNAEVASVTVNSENKSIATVALKSVGEAKITAKYADTNVTEIKSNVFVESGVNAPSAKKITISAKSPTMNMEKRLSSVEPKDLGYGDTLINSPTVLGALLKGSFNNIKVNKTTGYVEAIYGVEAKMIDGVWNGWQYKVNNIQPEKAAGVCIIKDDDKIEWYYGPIEF